MGRKFVAAAFLVLMVSSVSAASTSANYDGGIEISVQNDARQLSAGESLDLEIEVSNSDEEAFVDSYLVINIVKGGNHYYPSQQSNRNNVFHQEKIEDINLKSGSYEVLDYSYELPSDIKSGDYHVEAYFKTNRTPIQGIPFIYSSPATVFFQVEGQGGYPSLEISRTESFLTGLDQAKGDWDPGTSKFSGTGWPSITGPVGVLSTSSMETVEGEVVIQSHSSSSQQATVTAKVCEWDDTACSNHVDTFTETVSVPPSGTTVPVEVDNPSAPGAYAVKFRVSSNGETQSIYRNRIIREGNTSRIRKLSVNSPYVTEGSELSVGLVAGASADHYTDPVARNVQAQVTVETLEGETVMDKTKTIEELSNENPLEQLYFNKTVQNSVPAYTVSATLQASGETWDSYSYTVDYSDFDSSINSVEMEDYSFTGSGLQVEMCADTRAGTPANGEVQMILKKNGSISTVKDSLIEGCSEINFENKSESNYTLTANYGYQESFNITPASEERQQETPEDGEGGLPLIPIAAVVVLLIAVVLALSVRGDKQ